MRIVITGANGQVGKSLQEILASTSHEVLAIGRERLDITDLVAVGKALSEFAPDVVINAAAYTAVDKAESEPDLAHAINVKGPLNLSIVTHKLGATLIHISTDYVFKGDGDDNYSETSPTDPQSVYGCTKLAGEIAVTENNPKHIILRTAWVFGEHGNNFVKTMLKLGANRESLNVVADQYGAPTYAGDIAHALVKIAEFTSRPGFQDWGTYHFSGAPYTSWHGFSLAIFESAAKSGLLKKPAPTVTGIPSIEYPTPAKRPANSRLCCDKIYRVFGIAPSNWKKAIHDLSAYLG